MINIEIILSSKILTVEKINRKTKAKMFEDLKVGDKIQFEVELKRAGGNRGTYATYIKATNLENNEITHSSFNQMPRILDAFGFKEE